MIGIFDSGIGGMTVAHAIELYCPDYPLIYFGDLARAPYGPKSPATITMYARENSQFLLDQGASLIVVACNSAASIAADLLREQLPVPVLDVIMPAARQAARVSRTGRIGVIGTRATIQSTVYENKLHQLRQDARLFTQACPLLVPLVEEGWFDRRETKMVVKKYLHPLRTRQIDTLVLGCTHYPLLKKVIKPRIGRRVTLIDSSLEVARQVRIFLEQHPEICERLLQHRQSNRYFVSDMTERTPFLAAHIFGRPINLEQINGFH